MLMPGRDETGVKSAERAALLTLCRLFLRTLAVGAAAADTPDRVVKQRLTAVRDQFIRRILAEGYTPSLPAPSILLGPTKSFGNYDDPTNAVHMSTWASLSSDDRNMFQRIARAHGGAETAEQAFENGTYRWVLCTSSVTGGRVVGTRCGPIAGSRKIVRTGSRWRSGMSRSAFHGRHNCRIHSPARGDSRPCAAGPIQAGLPRCAFRRDRADTGLHLVSGRHDRGPVEGIPIADVSPRVIAAALPRLITTAKMTSRPRRKRTFISDGFGSTRKFKSVPQERLFVGLAACRT